MDQKDVNKTLALNKPSDVNPKIRIIDLSGTFTSCSSFYKQKDSPVPVPYFVINELSPSLNTGRYRDIVIHEFRKKEKKRRAVLSVAQYESGHNRSYNLRIVLIFEIVSRDNISIVDSIVTDYDDNPPNNDYEYYKFK